MTTSKKPLLLLILDGFGHSESEQDNAIQAANCPTWKALWEKQPKTLIHTSGMAVGLPDGQMGNSEVGHMTLGAGRVVYQNYTRINKSIEDGDFFTNPAYIKAIDGAVSQDKAVHVLGLLSPGGVHSHEAHIHAMLKMAVERGVKKVYLHAFLDGRDTPPRSAQASLEAVESLLSHLGCGRIASISGRFYGMDRDQRWERVKAAYDLLTLGEAEYQAETAVEGLKAAYERDETDEFVKPTSVGEKVRIDNGDSVIFMNFRPDRARQLTRVFVDPAFDAMERKVHPKLTDWVMTTEYAADIPASCAYPPASLSNSLGEFLEKQQKIQLRIAETEKYAHVTFFFSGGRESLYDGEERILVPSPKVETYDQQPEMSAIEVTDKLVEAIESGQHDVIICNYANCDQVGHTGVFDACIKAVESVDGCLSKVLKALESVGGEALITADHGNVEQMFDYESDQVHTQHTTLPVPLVYVGQRSLSLKDNGSLADVAPTLLALMGIEPPEEMTGRNLALFS